MAIKKPKNKRKSIFQFVMIIFLLWVWTYWYFRTDIYIQQKKINKEQWLLDTQNEQLILSQNVAEHHKLLAVKELEKNVTSMPWSKHIPKVIAMLESLKDVDISESETVVLSDFSVSLDSISLKWKVSSLLLLYINSPKRKIKSLLDKFADLDFIEDIRIQTYEKTDERHFEFVLDANVVIDGK